MTALKVLCSLEHVSRHAVEHFQGADQVKNVTSLYVHSVSDFHRFYHVYGVGGTVYKVSTSHFEMYFPAFLNLLSVFTAHLGSLASLLPQLSTQHLFHQLQI